MLLEEKHIDFIKNSLKFHGVKDEDLLENLLDHICTFIERQDSNDFNALYQEAIQKFGGYTSFKSLELETNFQKFNEERIIINKLKLVLGFIMVVLLFLGMLFKIMHWPYASSMLLGAILTFVIGVLPVLFYSKYKSSNYKFN